jgi:hypothetical protein
MKYAVEMSSGAMIYIPSFVKIGSAIQIWIKGDSQTHRQHGDCIRPLSFFQNKESMLKWFTIKLIILIQIPFNFTIKNVQGTAKFKFHVK